MKKKSLCILTYLFVLFLISDLYAQEVEEVDSTLPLMFSAVEGSVQQISENPDGSLIAVSDNQSVSIYDTKTFSLVWRFFDEGVVRSAFYSEGDSDFFVVMTKSGQFIVRSFYYLNDQWHFDDGEPYFSADCSDATGRKSLTAVSFSNNSDYVAAAFNDNTVQVHFRLRVTAASISHTITSHKAPVYGLEFSRNGEYLATVSTDGNGYIWNSYTTSRITQIKGVYTRAKVPVVFSSDSVYVIFQDGRNTFKITDFSGNTLYSIAAGRPITAIKPLKDPDLVAIRNDKGEVMVYSISSRRPLSITNGLSAKNTTGEAVNFLENDFTVFDYDYKADFMYAGYRNGYVYIVEPQPYLDDSAMLITDASLAGKGAGNFVHQKFSGISACGGANYLTRPYLVSVNLRGEYLYSEAISPFFVGGGLVLSMGFPHKDFPSKYKVGGQNVDAPKLFSATAYAPVGYAFSPWNNDFRILTTFKLGAKVSSLVLVATQGYAIGEPALSFYISTGIGMQYKHLEMDVNCEYDTIGKVSPSLYAGYVWQLGEKK